MRLGSARRINVDLELVSFRTCPFVQRAKITLELKGVPYTTTYIDLDSPPEWFKEQSPTGKVPMLKVNGDILFESAVINEFLDEITGGGLLPKDPLQKAKLRAWIEFASACNMDLAHATWAKDEASARPHMEALWSKLERVEAAVAGPFFAGKDFTLADTSFAPLLLRLDALGPQATLAAIRFPKLTAWSKTLQALPAVANTIDDDWRAAFEKYLTKKQSWFRA